MEEFKKYERYFVYIKRLNDKSWKYLQTFNGLRPMRKELQNKRNFWHYHIKVIDSFTGLLIFKAINQDEAINKLDNYAFSSIDEEYFYQSDEITVDFEPIYKEFIRRYSKKGKFLSLEIREIKEMDFERRIKQ